MVGKEKLFENKIKDYVKSIGGYVIKNHGDRYSKVGIPDLTICLNGHFVAVEVKAENGRPSELQLHHIDEIKKAGGYATILYPKDFENFKKEMTKIC